MASVDQDKTAKKVYHYISVSTWLKHLTHNPLPDDNFMFDENGRKFFKRVENTVGKGEIAYKEHFLLFPQCFLPV